MQLPGRNQTFKQAIATHQPVKNFKLVTIPQASIQK